MGKKIIISMILLLEVSLLFAQNAALNHSKYWFYRTRLRNEFMALGSGGQCGAPLGMNIPAGSAYESSGDIHFGDGTSFLGNYLAVLATEYSLLSRSGNSNATELDGILQELYWCLKTYERLDLQAEVLFPPHRGKCSNGINGFFCRDDVTDTITNFLGAPYRYDRLKNVFLTGPTNRKTMVTSHYKESHNAVPSDLYDNIYNQKFNNPAGVPPPSQHPFVTDDQMSNLMVGFAFVRYCLSDKTVNGENLGDLVSYYTSKIMDYNSANAWDLVVPFTGGLTAMYAGPQTIDMGYPLARAGENVFGAHWGGSDFTSGRWSGSVQQYSIDYWNCLNYPAGQTFYDKNYTGNDYNNAILSQLAAVGNSFEYGLVPIKQQVACVNVPCSGFINVCHNVCFWGGKCHNFCGNRYSFWDCNQSECTYLWHYEINTPDCLGAGLASTLAPIMEPFLTVGYVPWPLPKLSVNTTGLALAQYGTRTHTEIFSLEHRYLHRGTQYYGTNAINEYLNSAPCTGPHWQPLNDPHNDPSDVGVFGWRADNRFEKSNPNIDVPKDTDHDGWNGIDYMLLHNLYYGLHGQGTDITGFRNEMNYAISNVSYPRTAVPNGSASSPLTVNGFETITASNAVVANTGAQVQYHAGKRVNLQPGFQAKPGANFKAYIRYTFPCDPTNGYNDGSVIVPKVVPDTILDDSTKAMHDLTTSLNKMTVTAKDSLLPIINAQKASTPSSQYVPLSTWVQTTDGSTNPNQKSRIINVFPNPVSIASSGAAFYIHIYLAKIDPALKVWLVSSQGQYHSVTINVNSTYELIGEGDIYVDFTYNGAPLPSGIYSVVMQGSDFVSTYNVLLQ